MTRDPFAPVKGSVGRMYRPYIRLHQARNHEFRGFGTYGVWVINGLAFTWTSEKSLDWTPTTPDDIEWFVMELSFGSTEFW